MKHYLILETLKNNNIFQIVEMAYTTLVNSTRTTINFDGLEAVKLNSTQVERYENQKSEIEAETRFHYDLQEIITGTGVAPTFAELQGVKLGLIKASYDAEIAKGIKYTLDSVERTFNLDDNTEGNVMKQAVGSYLDDEDEVYQVTDASKVHRIFTRTEFLDFAKLFKRRLKGLKTQISAKFNDVYAAQDETALNAISLTFE